jgi:oxygen-independent coproporphyrinogen-3 oxidase
MHDDIEVTPALLSRLDRPVPRYTSYPTADRFGRLEEATAIAAFARADADVDVPLTLYAHIPFCAKMCTYCGCAVVVSQSDERKVDYVDRLTREVDLVAAHLPRRRGVRELHLGGGTPNSLSVEALGRFVGHLRQTFRFLDDAELSVELDPRRVVPGQLRALRALGFSRVSFGVQDTDDAVQAAIGRDQSAEVTRRAVVDARAAGFASVNVDLVYGLPQQTRESFAATVKEVIALQPDRIALFSFAYVPHVRPNQHRINAASLPPPDTKLELFCEARAAFLNAGYLGVGMDHFARPADPLAKAWADGRLSRTFQGYAVAGVSGARVDVVGFGMSAISDIGGAYLQNEKELRAYEDAIDAGHLACARGHVLSCDEEARRFAIRTLMCSFHLDEATLKAATGLRFADFALELARLEPLQQDGLVVVKRDSIEITPLGRLFVRLVAAAFDADLARAPSPTTSLETPTEKGALPVWSRAV